jgi:hypothetical protein
VFLDISMVDAMEMWDLGARIIILPAIASGRPDWMALYRILVSFQIYDRQDYFLFYYFIIAYYY